MSEEQKYIKDNNLEELVSYDAGQDYIAHDLNCPCGKDCYRTFSDARKMLKQRGKRGDKKEVYHCDTCGYFHITTKINHVGTKRKKFNRNKGTNPYKTPTADRITDNEIKAAKHLYNARKERDKIIRKPQFNDAPINDKLFCSAMSDILREDVIQKLKIISGNNCC